jgi:hypothetical protein
MEKMIAAHSIADLKFDEEYLYTASYDNSAAVWSPNRNECLKMNLTCGHCGSPRL